MVKQDDGLTYRQQNEYYKYLRIIFHISGLWSMQLSYGVNNAQNASPSSSLSHTAGGFHILSVLIILILNFITFAT